MICHDWYFFTTISETCTEEEFGLTRQWILLEIIIFYVTIVSVIIFLLISMFKLKYSGLMYLEKENSDFLETYNTITNFYTTFSVLIVVTLKQLINNFSSIQKG